MSCVTIDMKTSYVYVVICAMILAGGVARGAIDEWSRRHRAPSPRDRGGTRQGQGQGAVGGRARAPGGSENRMAQRPQGQEAAKASARAWATTTAVEARSHLVTGGRGGRPRLPGGRHSRDHPAGQAPAEAARSRQLAGEERA